MNCWNFSTNSQASPIRTPGFEAKHNLRRLDLVAIRPKLPTLMKTIVALLAGSFLLQIISLAAEQKLVFLYSRYFNAKGENRYLPDGDV